MAPTTIVRPWSPGDPLPAGLETLSDREELVAVVEDCYCVEPRPLVGHDELCRRRQEGDR